MNKLYFSVLFIFTVTGVFGCTTRDAASVHRFDAKVSRPDLAESRDLAHETVVFIDVAAVSDAGAVRDLLEVALETITVDATTSSPLDAFGIDRPDINLLPDAQAFNPLPGHYTVKADPGFAGSADYLGLLMAYGFTVTVDANGVYSFLHSIDGWARYTVSVNDGFFNLEHGAGFNGLGGTHCPTDGFGIRGSFISPTEARGVYGKMVRCQVNGPGYFIATLDQKADSGVLIDAVSTVVEKVDASSE